LAKKRKNLNQVWGKGNSKLSYFFQGYISYPRTESTQYAENFDLKEVLRQQQNSGDWGAECRALLQAGLNKPRKGHDAGDHPPITPCRSANRGELDGDSFKLYDYITRHFIGTISPNCKVGVCAVIIFPFCLICFLSPFNVTEPK
jgi:DNA topoisomerase IA